MQSKFGQVPVEKDTRIIYQREVKCADYDALYQLWLWDGVTAESIIFKSADVSELSDNQLESEVSKLPIFKSNSSITLIRSASGFTFVNFNFET